MNIIKLKNKFKYADDEAYLETKVVISYICTLTTWFQKSMLNGEIPFIKESKNKNLYKKSDVLNWVRENIHEINPTFQNPTNVSKPITLSWLGKWIKQSNNNVKSNQRNREVKNA